MKLEYGRNERGDLVAIAREASLYDWLIGLTRRRAHPQSLPRHLHTDLGLPPPSCRQAWPDWR
ncbi:hypothetical protein [Devosia elaeis]|jgi:hypothetical protein|uniref:Uncharacterized protein n=1 Tax=Devosia elaeis TaxID=1770058 RepID=A0A178I2N2_9HYPH|nr:hypothetical protein [Devosia elaeis]OAM79620.1 hypothetical protein A3840_02655 [Devosia elaeis]